MLALCAVLKSSLRPVPLGLIERMPQNRNSGVVIRAVFFDAAGTLFESREPVGHAYTRIARDFGVDAPIEAVTAGFRHAFGSAPGLAFGPGHPPGELRGLERRWWRQRVADSFAGLGEFRDFDAYFEALFTYFGDPAHWLVDPEAVATLQRLRNDGLRLGVISNFDHRVYRILAGLGLASLFDSITISSEAGFAKPRREIFDQALKSLGVEALDAMHVGDSAHLDLAAASEAGLAAVLIDPAYRGDPIIVGRTARIGALALTINVAQRFGFA
jgi:putative hydrolase of the HAD superfamily